MPICASLNPKVRPIAFIWLSLKFRAPKRALSCCSWSEPIAPLATSVLSLLSWSVETPSCAAPVLRLFCPIPPRRLEIPDPPAAPLPPDALFRPPFAADVDDPMVPELGKPPEEGKPPAGGGPLSEGIWVFARLADPAARPGEDGPT